MDQSQVCREEVPEEAGLRPHAQQKREEGGEAAQRQEMSEAQQHQQPGPDPAPLPTGRGKPLPLNPVRRYGADPGSVPGPES